MYKIPFAILVKRLQELNTPTKQIQEINWYMNQDGTPGALKADKSVFIRFLPTVTEDLANGIQEANLSFELLAFTANLKKDPDRVLATDHFDLVDMVYKQIADFSADFSYFDNSIPPEQDFTVLNTISRTGINTLHNNRNIMGTVQTFTSYVTDKSAIKYFQKYTGDATIEILNWCI